MENSEDIELSSRMNRLLAQIVDGAVAIIFYLPFLYYGLENGLINLDDGAYNDSTYELITGFGLWIIILAINIRLLKKYGQTIGKRFVYIKIVNDDNSQPTLKELLLKRQLLQWGAYYIPVIGFFLYIIDSLFIFGKSRTCIHDKIAKTKVVYV